MLSVLNSLYVPFPRMLPFMVAPVTKKVAKLTVLYNYKMQVLIKYYHLDFGLNQNEEKNIVAF